MDSKINIVTVAAIVWIFLSGCHSPDKDGSDTELSLESSVSAGRRLVKFNSGWKFAKGDQTGAEALDFDDSAWQAVRLPHDWAISGLFNRLPRVMVGMPLQYLF